jgi:large subunit ribosomal protein L15
MARRLRKVRKLRGSRTYGWGKVGQHRKSGSRGGFGKAGRHKHHWTWVLRYEPDYWGKRGFVSRFPRVGKAINVGELDSLVEAVRQQGKLVEEEGRPVLDLKAAGFDKLLGEGSVLRPLRVLAPRASELAVAKVKEAGGEVVLPQESSAAG